MSDLDNELSKYSAAEAAIEQYRAGGIIEHAISSPERNMDGIIQAHLGTVAMLNARGDTIPERPTYVFNPDTGLLINYAFRRHPNSTREGLFADIVELNRDGNARHGVSIVNPFVTETGFINVSVGENTQGFAPSFVRMKLEDNDPTSVTPPNIEMADLLAMLRTEAIPTDMNLDDFLYQRQETQDEMRAKTERHQRTSYLPNEQALDTRTNPNLHLIISDRGDVSNLEAASREVGVFPIVLTAREVIEAGLAMRKMGAPDEEFDRLSTFVATGRSDMVRSILGQRVPAFLTLDFENMSGPNRQEEREKKMVLFPETKATPTPPIFGVHQLLSPTSLGGKEKGVLRTSPFFSRIINDGLFVEEEVELRKVAHGKYEMAIDPAKPEYLASYTDWLRKVRLDYALTLYLRGLSQF